MQHTYEKPTMTEVGKFWLTVTLIGVSFLVWAAL